MKKAKMLMSAAVLSAGLATGAFAGGAKDGAVDPSMQSTTTAVEAAAEAGQIPAAVSEALIKADEILAISNKIAEHFRPYAKTPGRAQRIVAVQEQLQTAVSAMNVGEVRTAIDGMVGDMSGYDVEFEPHKPDWRPEVTLNGQIFELRAQAYYTAVRDGAVNEYKAGNDGEFNEYALRLGGVEKNNGREPTLPERAEHDMEYARDILEVRLKNEMPRLGVAEQTTDREFDDMFIDLIKASAEFNRIVMENNYYKDKDQDAHVTYEPTR